MRRRGKPFVDLLTRNVARVSSCVERGGDTVGAVPDAVTSRVLLVGAGGHARVVLEALLDGPGVQVIGAVSADGSGVPDLGVPVLGLDADLEANTLRESFDTVCVAIGDNAARRRWAMIATEGGHSLTIAVSRSAVVSRSATVAPGAVVLPGAVVNAATSIGSGAIVNTNASVDHDCAVGAFSHVAPGVAIGGGVTVGEGVLVGIGATVLPGRRIGDGAVVGAGAVVVHDVPPGATVVGNPARERSRRG